MKILGNPSIAEDVLLNKKTSKNNGAVVAAVAGTTTCVAGLTAVGTIVAVVLKRRRI